MLISTFKNSQLRNEEVQIIYPTCSQSQNTQNWAICLLYGPPGNFSSLQGTHLSPTTNKEVKIRDQDCILTSLFFSNCISMESDSPTSSLYQICPLVCFYILRSQGRKAEPLLLKVIFSLWVWFSPSDSLSLGFPGDSDDKKKSAFNAEDPGLIPGLGRSFGEGNGDPHQ